MEETKTTKSLAPVAWIAVGAFLGVAAWAFISRKREGESGAWDTDTVIKACENAANRLDEILLGEPAYRAS